MGQILGRMNEEYLLEDDGTLWDRAKTKQFDPATFLPVVDIHTPPPPEKMVERSKKDWARIKCFECGDSFGTKQGIKKHFFKVHKRVYRGGPK